MKNKNSVSKCLILLIIVLVGVTIGYVIMNKERIFAVKSEQDLNEKESATVNKETSSTNKGEPAENVEPIYSSDNQRDDFGLKTITSFEEFDSLVKRNVNTFFVFGRDGCHYCEMFYPVLKEVAGLYKIEIIYVDMAQLNADDHKAILNSSLTIPAKCSKSGEETILANGFGTPLTLFVNKGKTYDCIRGYKEKSSLITSLKMIGYIN